MMPPTAMPHKTAAVTSSLLSQIANIRHGFGSAAESIPLSVSNRWSQRPQWRQTHHTQIAWVTDAQQECGDVDGLATEMHDLPVAIATADCVPILLADSRGAAVAALHAGWRGLHGGIVSAFVKDLVQRGFEPRQWLAALGPAIGPCCYEVDPELIAAFSRQFTFVPASVLNPHGRHLDLPAIAEATLRFCGIEKTERIQICTRCARTPETPGDFQFFSHRRDQTTRRQWSAILRVSASTP